MLVGFVKKSDIAFNLISDVKKYNRAFFFSLIRTEFSSLFIYGTQYNNMYVCGKNLNGSDLFATDDNGNLDGRTYT